MMPVQKFWHCSGKSEARFSNTSLSVSSLIYFIINCLSEKSVAMVMRLSTTDPATIITVVVLLLRKCTKDLLSGEKSLFVFLWCSVGEMA